MNDQCTEAELLGRRLQGLLLDHLCAASMPGWPGADGLTLEAVLLTYPQAAAVGRVPGREQLLAEHPDLEEQLRAFFVPSNQM